MRIIAMSCCVKANVLRKSHAHRKLKLGTPKHNLTVRFLSEGRGLLCRDDFVELNIGEMNQDITRIAAELDSTWSQALVSFCNDILILFDQPVEKIALKLKKIAASLAPSEHGTYGAEECSEAHVNITWDVPEVGTPVGFHVEGRWLVIPRLIRKENLKMNVPL